MSEKVMIRARIAVLALMAAVVGWHYMPPAVAQDITDPITSAFVMADQITVVRNSHQRLAGPLNLLVPGSGIQPATCTMATATTCTATITQTYTATPACFAVDSAAAIAGTASLSGTTVTITAASSNSAKWFAVCIPFPN